MYVYIYIFMYIYIYIHIHTYVYIYMPPRYTKYPAIKKTGLVLNLFTIFVDGGHTCWHFPLFVRWDGIPICAIVQTWHARDQTIMNGIPNTMGTWSPVKWVYEIVCHLTCDDGCLFIPQNMPVNIPLNHHIWPYYICPLFRSLAPQGLMGIVNFLTMAMFNYPGVFHLLSFSSFFDGDVMLFDGSIPIWSWFISLFWQWTSLKDFPNTRTTM